MNTALIMGKGPTAKIISRKDYPQYDIILCINQALNFVDDPDIFILNDLDGINNIKRDNFAKIKTVIIPYYSHHNEGPQFLKTWETVKDNIPEFKGNFYIHYLATTPPKMRNKVYPVLHPGPLNSCTIAVEYLINVLGVKKIEFMGVGMGEGYSNLVPNREFYESHLAKNPVIHKRPYLDVLRRQLGKISKKHGVPMEFH